MGNCCKPFGIIRRYSSRLRQRKIVLLLVGLDNAGKSSTAKGLLKEPVDNILPTVGFNAVKLFHKGYSVIIYDLGGGPQIRDIWSRYFADVHGVIFVVDASDRNRLDECKKVFEDLLVNEKLAGKPVLLLANKQDKDGALDELDIVERLNVERIVNMQQCPTLVETCVAGAPSENSRKRKLDPGIENGYRWILRRIISEYDTLNRRVTGDQEIQRISMDKEREALRKRIKERKNNEFGDESDDEIDESAAHVTNPFQPIQVLVKEIEKKEVLLNCNEATNKSNITQSKPACSRKIDEIIDLENYRNGGTINHTEVSAVDVVREQLRQKSAGQKKKRLFLKKSNRLAPTDETILTQQNELGVSSPEMKHTGGLPPIRQRGPSLSWAQVSNGGQSHNGFAWELEKSLDVILPPLSGSQRPATGCSDGEDVVTALR